MIYKHRKLFPLETTTNQTQDCYGFCDPACPYNCYSNPDYYFSPPPPQVSEHSDQVNHISSYLIILVTLFTVIFLVVAFYVIKVKCYADWCGWRLNTSMVPQTENAEDILNENQVDHPVWLIATVGLQQSIINSISVCKYKKDEGLVEGTECSVCLNEFHEDETLRLLPKCNHAFHVPCIDTWLRSHTTCPLCRAAIVSSTNAANGAALPSTTLENSATNFERSQENFPEISRHDHDAVNVAVDEGESSEGLEFIDESNSKERVNDEVDTEMGSVSSNDPKLEVNCCSTESESNHGDGVHHIHVQSKTCKMRRSLIEECLHMSPVCMKRSFSCNGRTLSTRGYLSLKSKLHSSLLDFSIC